MLVVDVWIRLVIRIVIAFSSVGMYFSAKYAKGRAPVTPPYI
jgi:hypothetical protein